MKNLPADAAIKAQNFVGLSEERKAEILQHLDASPSPQLVETIMKNGGPEGRFVGYIYGKMAPQPGDVKENKKAAITNRK